MKNDLKTQKIVKMHFSHFCKLMSTLIKKCYNLLIASAFNLLGQVILVEEYKENLASWQYAVEKGNIVSSILRQLYTYCFDTIPKLNSWYFVKGMLHCEIWNHITKLLVFYFIKIIGLPYTSNQSSIYAQFCDIYHCYLENVGFTELCAYWHGSSHSFKKIVFINTTTHQKKPLEILGSQQDHSSRSKFSKILIFAWKPKFYHRQEMLLSAIFLEVAGALCSILRKWLPNTQ